MYWPNVLSIPLGPGPNLTMLVNPGNVRIGRGTLRAARTEDEANDEADSCSYVRLRPLFVQW